MGELLTVPTTQCGKLVVSDNATIYLNLEFDSGWRGKYFGTPIHTSDNALTFEAFGFMQEGWEFHSLSEKRVIEVEFRFIRCLAHLQSINMTPGNFQFECNGKRWYGY